MEAAMALDAKAFTAFEQAAHDRIAKTYSDHFTPLTSLALGPLLKVARISAGSRLLDVATGPGVAATAAHNRGAQVAGVDVSPGMIALARANCPTAKFEVAEVTALPFADGAFDAVICNFALGHFPEPEVALKECVRVMAAGGSLAFSWWDQPERQRVQGLFREAIAELQLSPPASVPQGHNTLRFSDPEPFNALLCNAGLADVVVEAHQTKHLMPDIEALWRAGVGGMAVTASAITAQDAATQAQVRDVIARRAEPYRNGRHLEIPIAYLIGSGRKV
jgi:ubiquinone/menaquinone biosynthesis C-methylase UbiE